MVHDTYEFEDIVYVPRNRSSSRFLLFVYLERNAQEKKAKRHPDDKRVLEALREIWRQRVPCQIQILQVFNIDLL